MIFVLKWVKQFVHYSEIYMNNREIKLKTYGVAYEYLDDNAIIWHIAPDADYLDRGFKWAKDEVIIEHGWRSWQVIFAQIIGDGRTEWELDVEWDRKMHSAYLVNLNSWIANNSTPSY